MLEKFLNAGKAFWYDENGLTTAEWVILASAIAAAALTVSSMVTGSIKEMGEKLNDTLEGTLEESGE